MGSKSARIWVERKNQLVLALSIVVLSALSIGGSCGGSDCFSQCIYSPGAQIVVTVGGGAGQAVVVANNAGCGMVHVSDPNCNGVFWPSP
jgi:hypothetical protein